MSTNPVSRPSSATPTPSGPHGRPSDVIITDCPILVWMMSLNREYTLEEYTACYDIVKECLPHVKRIKNEPENPDTFRQLMTVLLPLLMMRHRRIPRARWRDNQTANGKHWIEQAPDNMPPEKFLTSMIGYHLEYCNSICGMAMTQGQQRRVINIGLGIRQIHVEPRNITVTTYVEAMNHLLTPLEVELITKHGQTDEVTLRRLCIVLSCKDAYIKAIGQPVGFDYRRLEFNIPEEKATGDGHPLTGWEFRIFKAQLGVSRRAQIVEEQYQCVCAFFRGMADSKFVWYESKQELESWVQFINIDQMVKVVTKLTA
ncbi:hypothetical protein BD626DRAFT_495424 [Schizophyllum amplum]|uniref:holo-[acyl-carrier-protein] synthase n=1 Tax=Schizophyllum amplum TaxID=97359 RepID=A0A550CE55_9AGAR|nr:hypothetical protein BD626DRAFT_495424 [Auriculariopsis ampla]